MGKFLLVGYVYMESVLFFVFFSFCFLCKCGERRVKGEGEKLVRNVKKKNRLGMGNYWVVRK